MIDKEKLQETLLLMSKVVRDAYNNDNYKIVDLDSNKKIVFIFFSSNGLYYPNTEREFKKKIIIDDKFEWENIAQSDKIRKNAGRIIYVRDVYKQWYVTGINSRQRTIDDTYNLLLQLTEGYDVITVGGSSGGYAAVLFGIKLKAKRVYSFSGQFSITDGIDEYYWLNKYKDNSIYSQYYNLVKLVQSNFFVPIYYFYPARNKADIEQSRIVENVSNVYSFAIDSDEHAKTLIGENFPFVLTSSNEELKKIYYIYLGSVIGQGQFLRKCAGVFYYFKTVLRRLQDIFT